MSWPRIRAGASWPRACAVPTPTMPSSRRTGSIPSSVRSQDGEALRVIGSIRQVIVAPRERRANSSRRWRDPQTRIVSLTVTEKGYCHDPATGALNEAHPDIVHDLADPQAAPIGARLHRRGPAPPPRGGRAAIHGADLRQPSVQRPHGEARSHPLRRTASIRTSARFVADEVSCPSTMVDRIVPATTDEDRGADRAGARRRPTHGRS